MDDVGTNALREFAARWSLAGDDQLLTILQNTHQKIISKSQEVNAELNVMVAGLDNASITLQNVNNKFMALSNSQFIESRVYDDDEDITKETKPIKEAPKQPTAESELSMLKHSLSVLESMHEVVTILRDSDTESDSDDDAVARVVMKPKDLYAHRPLPYIIGSQAWKNKWHAGLHVEDSESDSSTSKPDRESEQYSDSEPEPDARPDGSIQTDALHLPDNTISETSSDLLSEQDAGQPSPSPTPAPAPSPSPAAVAATLAERLRGQLPHVEQQYVPPEHVPPRPAVKTVYRPHQPTTGTIFSDEPPPIDKYVSSSSEEDSDIFAELHKKQPYKQISTDNSRLADDLFDFSNKNEGDIFSDFATNKVPIPSVKPKSTLYEDEPEPELFASNPSNNKQPPESDTGVIKKPVGGISLFGTNKGAESIGAAILKRNQRKSSSNDDSESDEPLKPQTKTQSKPKVQTKTIEPAKPEIKVRQPTKEKETSVKKEKDIFDDLFAKSEKLQKKQTIDKDKKVDLFSDNLFDDIDDIFTSNIVKTKRKIDKPIFEADDDLFADIAVTQTNSNDKQKDNKGLFDSDDDLFAETPKITNVSEERVTIITNVGDGKVKGFDTEAANNNESKKDTEQKKQLNKSKEVEVPKQTKSIFDDDSSDNDIFSSLKPRDTREPKPTKLPENKHQNTGTIDKVSEEREIIITNVGEGKVISFDTEAANNNESIKDPEHKQQLNKSKKVEVPKQTKSIFDDDSSDNDIFSSLKPRDTREPKPTKLPENKHQNIGTIKVKAVNDKAKDTSEYKNAVKITKTTEITKVIKESKSIFDDDSDSDIFSNINSTLKNNAEITQPITNLETDHTNNINDSNNLINEDESHIKDKIMINNEKLPFNSPSLFDDDDEELFANSEESITVNKNTFDVVKVDSASNVLKTSHIIKETVITHENNKQTYGLTPKNEEIPEIVETKDELNDSIPKSSETVIKNIADTPKVIETVEEPPPFEIQTKLQLADEKIESKKQEPDIFNDDEPAPDPINIHDIPDNNTEENNLFAAEKDSVLIKSDIFSDIFTEPPAFEKLKEPKGSQNVNALFGDDSDDEALFFKKDDIISDVKPDIFVPNTTTDMFGIFVDEPPAIDVDFVTKSDLNDGIFDSYDDLFQSNATPQKIDNKVDIVPKVTETLIKKGKELPKSIVEDSSSELDKIDAAQAIDVENKKVGKLKTMNFKIDVNALLPGGSPKKQLIEQVDGQAVSTSNEELSINKDKVESKMVKSVSFEGKPDSEVLDNKLSKERAKIQVKRRPSTRRARREAVRKSVIDLDNDSTDNSSSIDDVPKSRPVVDKIENKLESIILDKADSNDLTKARDVKSKVVYILNDEDIFDMKSDTIQTTEVETPKLDIVDIIKSHKTDDIQSKDITDGVSTLGNVYKRNPTATTESSNSNVKSIESQPIKARSSLFGELSEEDDELFSKNKSIVKKTNIFESDSDDDLFTGKSKNKIKKETVERKVVKGSLFGDDDDDDLFGVKTKKIPDPIPQSSKSTTSREPTKSTEPAFDDPLSMFEDYD